MLVLVSLPFLHVVDHKSGTGYAVLPTTDRNRRDSNLLHRTKSNSSKTSTRVSRSALPQVEPSKHSLSLVVAPLLVCQLLLVNCQRRQYSL
jgi:hypothetical protein